MDKFSDYKAFAAYLQNMRWLAEDSFSSVEAALAAFESTQRRAGAEAARMAMDRAARRVW